MVLQSLFRLGAASAFAVGFLFLVLWGCAGQGAPSEASKASDSSSALASVSKPVPQAPSLGPPSSASAPVLAPVLLDAGADAQAGDVALLDAGTDAAPDADAPVAEAPFAKDNKILPPQTSDELQARAKLLFEAITKNEPSVGDPFWFPKEPFIPLKDVKDPGKYWENLHKAYANDIAKLHRKRKSWEGAEFKRFDLGSAPKWVPPGDEANKIGYYRSFRGKLRYELDGTNYSFEVHTVISWQGRWFITHLSKFKKK